jgi:hypothetical protein
MRRDAATPSFDDGHCTVLRREVDDLVRSQFEDQRSREACETRICSSRGVRKTGAGDCSTSAARSGGACHRERPACGSLHRDFRWCSPPREVMTTYAAINRSCAPARSSCRLACGASPPSLSPACAVRRGCGGLALGEWSQACGEALGARDPSWEPGSSPPPGRLARLTGIDLHMICPWNDWPHWPRPQLAGFDLSPEASSRVRTWHREALRSLRLSDGLTPRTADRAPRVRSERPPRADAQAMRRGKQRDHAIWDLHPYADDGSCLTYA